MTEPTTPDNGHRVRAYVDFLFKWRWLVLLGTLGIGALAASGGRFIEFKNDYQYFFREDNPQLRAFEDLQDIYTKNDNILIVVAPESGRVFETETLAAVGEITDGGWQLPFATRVDSITNFQYSHAEEDDLIVDDLVDLEREYTADELAELQEIALAEPLLKRRLISDDAHVTAIFVRHTLPREKSDEATQAALAARELAADIESKYPGHSVYLTGGVMLSNSFFEASVQDLSTLVPLMYLVLLVTAILFLRSFWGMLITLVIILLSASSAMGIAGWLGIPITPPSSSAPTVIMTLAVADSIHLLVTLFQSMGKGMRKKEAMTESLRINLGPVFLTSLTTAIGLLGLNLSDVRPFNDLGNIATIGVTAAFLYTLLVLPPLVAIFPIREREKPAAKGWTPVVNLGELVIARRKALLWFGGVAIAFLSVMVTRNELNDEFVEYFDESFAFRTDTDFTSENLSGIYTMEFSLGSGEEGGISDPDYLAHVDAFANWARQQPDVQHVFTITDTFKRLNKNMHADDPEWYALPKERDLAAQYLLLYELSLPYGLDLNDRINIDKSATRVTATIEQATSAETKAFFNDVDDWMNDNLPSYMHAKPTSAAVMFTYISERNMQNMVVGTILAIAAIALIMMFSLRSVRLGTLSLVPNGLPILTTFGAMIPITRSRVSAIRIICPSAFSSPKSSRFTLGPSTATGLDRRGSVLSRKSPWPISNFQTSGSEGVTP